MANTTPTQSRTIPTQCLPLSPFWSMRREASLNWLALGLLLAAWNASDNEVHSHTSNDANHAGATVRRRPEALRGYTYVSVRAANRITAQGW